MKYSCVKQMQFLLFVLLCVSIVSFSVSAQLTFSSSSSAAKTTTVSACPASFTVYGSCPQYPVGVTAQSYVRGTLVDDYSFSCSTASSMFSYDVAKIGDDDACTLRPQEDSYLLLSYDLLSAQYDPVTSEELELHTKKKTLHFSKPTAVTSTMYKLSFPSLIPVSASSSGDNSSSHTSHTTTTTTVSDPFETNDTVALDPPILNDTLTGDPDTTFTDNDAERHYGSATDTGIAQTATTTTRSTPTTSGVDENESDNTTADLVSSDTAAVDSSLNDTARSLAENDRPVQVASPHRINNRSNFSVQQQAPACEEEWVCSEWETYQVRFEERICSNTCTGAQRRETRVKTASSDDRLLSRSLSQDDVDTKAQSHFFSSMLFYVLLLCLCAGLGASVFVVARYRSKDTEPSDATHFYDREDYLRQDGFASVDTRANFEDLYASLLQRCTDIETRISSGEYSLAQLLQLSQYFSSLLEYVPHLQAEEQEQIRPRLERLHRYFSQLMQDQNMENNNER